MGAGREGDDDWIAVHYVGGRRESGRFAWSCCARGGDDGLVYCDVGRKGVFDRDGGEVGENGYFEGENAAGGLVVGDKNVGAAIVVDVDHFAVKTGSKQRVDDGGGGDKCCRIEMVVHKSFVVELGRHNLQRTATVQIENAKQEIWS